MEVPILPTIILMVLFFSKIRDIFISLMVQLLGKNFINRRRQAIRAVVKACLPEFLNKVFLRVLGLVTLEGAPEAIDNKPHNSKYKRRKNGEKSSSKHRNKKRKKKSSSSKKSNHHGSRKEDEVDGKGRSLSENEESPVEDTDDEEQEDVSDYCTGGYHVVNIGDLFQGRYHVIRKLGWGHFSTVWLAWDLTEKKFVALKIVKSAAHYTETAIDEMKLLIKVREADPDHLGCKHVVQLLDDFKVSGIHGNHICMVFEVLGHNLLKFIIKSSYHGISIPMAKSIIRQTLAGLDYLHTKCNIIHTDVKPENILVCITEDEIQKLAVDATLASQKGKLSKSQTATAPKHIVQKQTDSSMKMSKNKKKKMKQKLKKQLQKHQNEVDEHDETSEKPPEDATITNASETSTTTNENDENNRTSPVAMDISSSNNNLHDDGGDKSKLEKSNSVEMSEEPLTSEKEEDRGESSHTTEDDSSTTLVPSTNSFEPPVFANGDICMSSVDRKDTSKSPVHHNMDTDNSQQQQQQPTSTSPVPTKSKSPSPIQIEVKEVEKTDKPVANGTTSVEDELVSRLKLDSSASTDQKDQSPFSLDNPEITVKIADLGNACWTNHHFTEEIQTRQYRSLEVLLGAGYGTPADIWSTACMAFELVTGDFLFEPHSSEEYSRDEDHIALIMETLGRVPKHIALNGKFSKEFFTRKGELRHIKKLKPWSLTDVMMQKYDWSRKDAEELAGFLTPMLDYVPEKRVTAAECLKHPWLQEKGESFSEPVPADVDVELNAPSPLLKETETLNVEEIPGHVEESAGSSAGSKSE
ncbi:SRSF protein kinase 3-like isoform X1 [Clytia hemisphaerica]|uniref:SRSF protein kinase 3-like isoform X1 n=1 Tax=Clytia hemisphaerica TaxID=252671 RepID=UPI0034D67B1E